MKFFIIFMVMFSVAAQSVSFETHYRATSGPFTGIVTTNGLNIRAGKGTSFPVVRKAEAGQEFSVIRKIDDWYEVKMPDIVGYIHGDYVKILSENNDGTLRATANTSSVNIRERPTTKSSKLGKVSRGFSFTILSKEKEWYKILVKVNETAFAHSDYIIDKENSAAVLDTARMYIRSGPTPYHSVVRVSSLNEQVYVIEEKDGFSHVILADGKTGWISSEYVKKVSFESVADEIFSEVIQYIDKTDYDTAYEKAAEIYGKMVSSSEKASAAFYMGLCAMKQSNLAEACTRFSETSKLDPYCKHLREAERLLGEIQKNALKNAQYYTVDLPITGLHAADVTGNKREELIADSYKYTWGRTAVYSFDGSSFGRLWRTAEYEKKGSAFSVAGDFQGTGTAEIITCTAKLILSSSNAGEFHSSVLRYEEIFPLPGVIDSMEHAVAGDFNNDGRADALFWIREKTSRDSFRTVPALFCGVSQKASILSGNDSDSKTLFLSHTESGICFLGEIFDVDMERFFTLYTVKNNMIEKVRSSVLRDSVAGPVIAAVSADLNADGMNDLITVEWVRGTPYITAYRNSGENFIPVREISIRAEFLAAADIDGDGIREIAAASKEGVIYIFHGLGRE